jgi:hypothetical protein
MIEGILYFVGGIFLFYIGVSLFGAVMSFAFGLLELVLTVLWSICYGIYYLVHRIILRRGPMRFNRKTGSFSSDHSSIDMSIDKTIGRSVRRSTFGVGRSIGRSTEREEASRERPSFLPRKFKTYTKKKTNTNGSTSTHTVSTWEPLVTMWGKFVDLFREREK